MKVKTLIDEIRFINTHIKENKDVFTINVKKLNSILDYIDELEEENKTLKELNVCVGCNNNPDYKSRIDKAIKYLKLKVDIPKNHLEEAIKDREEDLLKILGEEEND